MNRKKIEVALLKVGVPASIKGFKYIVDAVMILDEPGWQDPKFTLLYAEIGKRNNSTGVRVERAIRHALETVRSYKGNPEAVYHYFGYENCANSDSLMMFYTVLKNETEKEDNQVEETGLGNININFLRGIIRREIKAALADEAKRERKEAVVLE